MPRKSRLYREIHEQPDVLAQLLDCEKDSIQSLANHIRESRIDHVFVAARGSSDNAGRYAQYLLGAVNRLPVALTTPSLFTIYNKPPRFGNALVLGISQSGKSPDIVSVLEEARKQGVLTAAITNVKDSPLAAKADHVIDLCAGEERSIAATKTYTSQLMVVGMLSASLAEDTNMQASLSQVPRLITEALSLNPALEQLAERYRYMQDCVVIGRGFNYATAFEFALKLKELTYTIAEPYSSADFLHGPLALIEHGFPVFVIAPSGKMTHELGVFINQLRARDAEVIAISDNDELRALGHRQIRLPAGVPEWLSPLTAIVPGQLFSMYLAGARFYDPDHPRGLRKVTETT
jgi:glucosamine--fructose-6-phosphate aminotransferase (isomerizing)